MKTLFTLAAILFTLHLNGQNSLVGNWTGKYSLDYYDTKFTHFPLPYTLSFSEDSLNIRYYDEFLYSNDDEEKYHYVLKNNVIEFHIDSDTFQVLMVGISKDTLAIFGAEFDEGIMVFIRIHSDSKIKPPSVKLCNRVFALQDKNGKTKDTLEFYPGSVILSYNEPYNWGLGNYEIIELEDRLYLWLGSEDYSLFPIIDSQKNKIILVDLMSGPDTLTLTELIRPKKNSLTRTKWKHTAPEKPCTSVIAGFNDSLLIVTADKKDVLSHYFLSFNEKILLTLPENYNTIRNKKGYIPASSYNLYDHKKVSSDQINFYNRTRGMKYDPFVCGRDFELRMIRTK